MTRMSPAEYGEYLASQAPPITDEQAAAAARIIVAAESIQTRSETPLSERAHSVYRHVGADGEVLYIGCTVDVVDRSKAHKRQSPWFTSTTTVEVVADGLPRSRARSTRQQGELNNLTGERLDLLERAATVRHVVMAVLVAVAVVLSAWIVFGP